MRSCSTLHLHIWSYQLGPTLHQPDLQMKLSVAVSPCPLFGHLWRSLYECPNNANMELSVSASHCPFYSQFLCIFCPHTIHSPPTFYVSNKSQHFTHARSSSGFCQLINIWKSNTVCSRHSFHIFFALAPF